MNNLFCIGVLEILGYRNMSDGARERLYKDMASQAERAGLWACMCMSTPDISDQIRGGRARKRVPPVHQL